MSPITHHQRPNCERSKTKKQNTSWNPCLSQQRNANGRPPKKRTSSPREKTRKTKRMSESLLQAPPIRPGGVDLHKQNQPQALHASTQPFFPCPRQHAYVLPLAYSQCCLCTSNLLKNRKGYNWGAQSHSCLPLMCTKFYHTTALWSHFQTQYL